MALMLCGRYHRHHESDGMWRRMLSKQYYNTKKVSCSISTSEIKLFATDLWEEKKSHHNKLSRCRDLKTTLLTDEEIGNEVVFARPFIRYDSRVFRHGGESCFTVFMPFGLFIISVLVYDVSY